MIIQKTQDVFGALSETLSAADSETSTLFEKDRTPIRLYVCLRDVVPANLPSFGEISRRYVSTSLFSSVIIPCLQQKYNYILRLY